jgi:hypothetical protein
VPKAQQEKRIKTINHPIAQASIETTIKGITNYTKLYQLETTPETNINHHCTTSKGGGSKYKLKIEST